ncbi:uncharacterized protein LOC106140771 isoform X2 [Amyelois transitella]|uniref:uncharacterized protein LOC106140771 isoform X2 n=1 Tax=Amyelois transitella TaxID=680683 RepID=UPI0029903522|nr:uncharacterized protein LOC106140771 isoform X2 [Amyelois transitella]
MGRGQELLDAAREGDRRTVEKILGQIAKRSGPFTSLRRGAGVNVQDDNGYTPLHHACLHGRKEIVRLLLAADASPCVVDKKGATPLHLAAFKGDSDVVAMLLAHNNPPVNIDQLTSDHETALLIAAHFGYVDVVAQLMAKGADVTIENNNGESALDLAAQYGRLETVQHLLRVRPELVDQYYIPDDKQWIFTSTPLHRASKHGRKEVVAALIKAGVDPNIRTANGTALHEAVCFGKHSVVRVLLDNGANIDARDSQGKTVYDLLADYSEEATRRVRRALKDYESRRHQRSVYESDDDLLPPFPVPGPDHSPTGYHHSNIMKAPETQKNINLNKSLISPSSSSLTKNHPQSFVKKLASKCLGLKAKFNSAPNISNNSGHESVVDVKNKGTEHKTSNTLLIGNSKFFNKILLKKEESGEINCNDEFDTISLDRISTLNRDSVVNKSNRSCPGFKTSLPNISENNELSDSQDSVHEIADDFVVVKATSSPNTSNMLNVSSRDANLIFEPRDNRMSVSSNHSSESAHFTNECYESFEFTNSINKNPTNIPQPPPRPSAVIPKFQNENKIYENVTIDPKKNYPVPAVRTHLPSKKTQEPEKPTLYENISLAHEKKTPQPPKRIIVALPVQSNVTDTSLRSNSRSSSTSTDSDSFIDESNLEDILLSEKSKSFRRSKDLEIYACKNEAVVRTLSNASDMTDITDASAIENVDCSEDVEKSMYLPMTGTLPTKKKEILDKKHIFRHKTFTNIEIDRNSYKAPEFPKWNNDFLKETLASYHIRGTGHCIYKAPTVQEFFNIFNRDTLRKPSKTPDDNIDSFETAICFCKPKLNKNHNSAEDLLDVCPLEEHDQVNIDFSALSNVQEMNRTSFRCFCDSKTCTFHSDKRDSGNLIVKFSAIKKSISTPDITLGIYSSLRRSGLIKNKSVPSNLEEPYAVVNLADIIARNNSVEKVNKSPIYTPMFPHTTLSSTSSSRLYSIKDIADVISLSDTSTSTTAPDPSASDTTLHKSGSEYAGHWSLQTCDSNVTIKSDATFVTCFGDSSDDSDDTLHSDEDVSDAETVKSDVSTTKRPWVHSNSFNFGHKGPKFEQNVITEEMGSLNDSSSSKVESGISVKGSESSFSDCDDGIPRVDGDVSLGASLERGSGVVAGVRSGSGRRRWDEAEGTSEGDALSISSAASSCAPLHLAHHHEYNKVSPTPPKKPPRRNLSVSPTHANSPSSGYSYELRPHARSQDDLDDIQGAKHYLKHGRSVDQYVDGKLSYVDYEDHPSPRIAPVPNPRPSLKNRTQPVAITAMYENVVIKEQNPRRKLRRNNFGPQNEGSDKMNDNRVRKYSHQERSSLESLLDDISMNSPSDGERYYDGHKADIPLSPTHYDQPPTPDHPPPSARQAENSIHERIRPLSQLIMEVVEEIRIRKKSQGDITSS